MTYNQINEYYCNTCKVNDDIETVDTFERSQPTSTPDKKRNFFIPLRKRKTSGVCLVFTKGSIMYHYHSVHGQHHDWGNVAEAEQKLKEEKEVIQKLRDQSVPLL